ncbi:hypothetical protein N9R56_02590 [Gammaproteobacteria bacterium]|nr:hypothetical protein [Gammaproteobacteria bacterium]
MFAVIAYHFKFINVNSFIVWVGLFAVPLFLNYFLFSPYLFPDQFSYTSEFSSVRSTGKSIDRIAIAGSFSVMGVVIENPVTWTGRILGIVPLPTYMTVTSLAFANKFLLFSTFLLLKKYFINENMFLLFFLIPSIVLYSSLSLRDTLIICISLGFFFSMMRGRYLIALILLLPLLNLKLQMFAFLALYFVGRLFFRAHKSMPLLIFYLVVLIIIAFIFEDDLLPIINGYRYGFAAEDLDLGNGVRGYAAWGLYGAEIMETLTINSIPDLIGRAIIGLPYLLLMPMPWEWSNIFYPIQAAESVMLIALYCLIAIRYNLLKNQEFLFLSAILLIALLCYSVLVFNEGTFVRYRFTLFYPFLISIFYLGQKSPLINQKRLLTTAEEAL